MASVQTQQQASYSMSTSSTLGPGGGPPVPGAGGIHAGDLSSWGLALPIAQRGLFFQDNYFQKAREHFETSVKNVLSSMGQQQAFAQPLQDSLNSYRQLRCGNQKEETQAVSAVEDVNNYKMILDVRDFMGGDLKVNVIGDNELLVEGKLEKTDQGTMQTRTFKQRFLLPRGVDIQESSSALSSDGILTIITPKLTQEIPSQSLYMVNEPRKSQSNQAQYMDGGPSQTQQMFDKTQTSQSKATQPSHSSQSHDSQFRNSSNTSNKQNNSFENLNNSEPTYMDGGTSQTQQMFDKIQTSQSQSTQPSHSSQSQDSQLRNSSSTSNKQNNSFENISNSEPVFLTQQQMYDNMHTLKSKSTQPSQSSQSHDSQLRNSSSTSNKQNSSFEHINSQPTIKNDSLLSQPLFSDPRPPGSLFNNSEQSQSAFRAPQQSVPMFNDLGQPNPTFRGPGHAEYKFNESSSSKFTLNETGRPSQSVSSDRSRSGQVNYGGPNSQAQYAYNSNLSHPQFSSNESASAQTKFDNQSHPQQIFHKPFQSQMNAQTNRRPQSLYSDPNSQAEYAYNSNLSHPQFSSNELNSAQTQFDNQSHPQQIFHKPFQSQMNAQTDRRPQSLYSDPNSQAQYAYNSNLSHPQFSSNDLNSAQTQFNNQSHPQQIFHKPFQSQMNAQTDRRPQSLYSDGGEQSPLSPSQSKDTRQQQCIFHKPNQQQSKQDSSRQPQKGYSDGSRSPFLNSAPAQTAQSSSMLCVPGRSPYMYSDHSDLEDSYEDQDYSDTDQSDVIQHQQRSMQQQQQPQQLQQPQQAAPVQMMRPKLMRSNSHIDRNNYSLFDTEFTSGMLPILRRGYFNHDSFFQEAQKDFQRAVNDVLAKSGMPNLMQPGMQAADPFTSYRSLRAKDLKEENQAATVSEDDKAQKIVIDVADFINDGEVNVKVVNDKDIVIEGRVEKNDGGSKAMKNFNKQFALSPNADLDSITSVVSADGVLAITIPKKAQMPKIKERKIPLMKEGPGTLQASSGGSTPTALDMSSQKRDYIVPIILEDDENEQLIEKELEALHVASSLVDDEEAKLGQATKVDAATSPVPTFGSIFAGMVPTAPVTPVSIISPPMSPPIPSPTPTPPVSPPAPTPPVSPPPAPIVAPPAPIIPVAPPAPPTPVSPPPPPPRSATQSPARQAIINQLKDKKPSQQGPIRFPRAHGYVPVVKKGDFETDPEFENDKPEMDSAIKTALKCKGIEAPPGEEKATYKKMRKESPNDEDVAFSFSEHNQGYKIVLDMEDYNVREPEIQIHGENDLVIVGVAERKDEEGEPIHFRRQFVFPKLVNMEAITSAVSADGVLTVKAPLKVPRMMTKVSTSEPSEPVEEDEIPSGVPLNMLVGTFLDIDNRPETFDKDPIFLEPKCHYPSAMRAAIKRSGVTMGDGETEAQCYRRIRDNEKNHKNQAVMTIEGDEYYKVIVDMEDYMNTEIKVRLLGFNTFVVECYQEKNGKYKRIWSRQFVLPNHIQMEKMTGALSNDGKLVLNVPKRVWKHVGNTDASGVMRVGWMKTYRDDRVFTSDSCKTGVTTPFKTLPFKGLRDW